MLLSGQQYEWLEVRHSTVLILLDDEKSFWVAAAVHRILFRKVLRVPEKCLLKKVISGEPKLQCNPKDGNEVFQECQTSFCIPYFQVAVFSWRPWKDCYDDLGWTATSEIPGIIFSTEQQIDLPCCKFFSSFHNITAIRLFSWNIHECFPKEF